MNGKAVKFGGTSLCDANTIQKVAEIVKSDPTRRVIVVSAPGKRETSDEKITDLLIRADQTKNKSVRELLLSLVALRFDEMIKALSLPLDFKEDYEAMRTLKGDALISRGEYFSARIVSAFLKRPFLDAADCIFFRADGTLDEAKTRRVLGEKLSRMERAVIPGFYGAMPDGTLRVFSRGGSDITGAIAADAMNAEIYENFTDVSGFLFADPSIIKDAVTVPLLSYKELRYLSAKGACVLHADAILPLRKKQIPVVIRNTFSPHGPHTWIVPRKEKGVGGVVASSGYTLISLERAHIGEDKNAVHELLRILSTHGFSPAITALEADTLSVLLRHCDHLTADRIAIDIQQKMEGEIVTVRGGIAELAVAGEGLSVTLQAEALSALAAVGIRPFFISGTAEEFSFVIGVAEAEKESAVRAIYEKMVGYI